MIFGIILCIRCFSIRKCCFLKKGKSWVFRVWFNRYCDCKLHKCAGCWRHVERGCGDGCRPNIEPLCELTGLWPDFVITLLELVTKRQEKVTKSFEFSGIQFYCELNSNHPISTLNQSLSRRKASRKESKQNFRWVITTVCLPSWLQVFNNS